MGTRGRVRGSRVPGAVVHSTLTKSALAANVLFSLFRGSGAQGVSQGGAPCEALNESHTLTDLEISNSDSGASIISWSFPSDVCIDGFVVAATPLDTFGKQDGDTTYFETHLQSTSVPEVEYLRPYNFEVQVKALGGGYGPKVSTIVTPYGTCSDEGTPGRISSLAVLDDQDGFNLHDGDTATVCWTAPTDGACVDQYTLGRRMRARNDAEAFNDDFQWKFFTFAEAGCHEIQGHVAGRVYDFGIRATNAKNDTAGPVTGVEAYMRDAWVCLRGGIGYELCSAGEQQQCTAMDCEQVSNLGLCGAPFVRTYDQERKIVVQYCSEKCSCNVPTSAEVEHLSILGEVPAGILVDDGFSCCARPES